MKLFSRLPNIIFIIGDLAQNTSPINRRYFNLAANGPLNAGNRSLTHNFERFGYSVVDLDRFRPAALDPRLARRLAHDHKYEDGHLWIAHRGRNAYEALNLVNTD